MQTKIMKEAQQKIDALNVEVEAIERQARIDAERQERESRIKANEEQARINQIVESATALLQQNAKDMIETLQKVEEMVTEARAIAKAFNDHTPGFLLDDSVSLFCKDPVEFLKESLESLTIATQFNAPEKAVKVVCQTWINDGKIKMCPDQVVITSEREAERMIRRSPSVWGISSKRENFYCKSLQSVENQ